MVIKSLQVKHCQKGILSFNITVSSFYFLFIYFFPVAQHRNSMALQHGLIQHNMPFLVTFLLAVLLSEII